MLNKIRNWLMSELHIAKYAVKKLYVAGVVLVLLVYCFSGCGSSKHINATPDFYATPNDLITYYSNNEKEAEKRVNGKIIEIVGIVNDKPVVNDDGDEVFLITRGYRNGTNYLVRVFVKDRDQAELQNYRPGSTVVFRGECYGGYFRKMAQYVIDIDDAAMIKCYNYNNAADFVRYMGSLDSSKSLL